MIHCNKELRDGESKGFEYHRLVMKEIFVQAGQYRDQFFAALDISRLCLAPSISSSMGKSDPRCSASISASIYRKGPSSFDR